MEWKTRVTELLGSRYPIIQGAFGGFGTSRIAAPVSEAGGFGIITAMALRTPEKLREDIRRARTLTDKPFGVNLSVPGVPPLDEMLEVCIEERIPVVETAGHGADVWGKRLKQEGVKWIHKAATVKHLLHAQQQGADAVVILGLEGAGFKNLVQLPTMTGVGLACKQISIPVIAAGGISDARTFLAVLALGAEGVYMGTAFMVTRECPISEKHKLKMIKSDPYDPIFRNHILNPPNLQEYQRVMEERGSMPDGEWTLRLARVFSGVVPDGPAGWVGDKREVLKMRQGSMAVAFIDRIITAKELIEGIINGADEIVARGFFRGISRPDNELNL